jgi:hypothetical protein
MMPLAPRATFHPLRAPAAPSLKPLRQPQAATPLAPPPREIKPAGFSAQQAQLVLSLYGQSE